MIFAQSMSGANGGLMLWGSIAVVPSGTGGWHIHAGYTCADKSAVKGHYFTPPTDPWIPITYTSDANGVAHIALLIKGFSLYETMPVAGRALVVHDPGGKRSGCGVLGNMGGSPQAAEVTLASYPGTSNLLGGTLVIDDVPETVRAALAR